MKKIIILIVLIQVTIRIQSQPSTIHVNNQDIFINGMNLAWISFANDIGSGYDQAKFTQAVTAIHAAGGNTLRWWIHVNGTNNPKFTNDSVTGINTSDLKNLKNALDIAYQNGVLIDLCLWSFDMLQSGLTADQVTRNQLFLSDSNYTKAYIRNALIPMVKYLNNHPAILCWEVFNEPEGMCSDVLWKGWTPNLTSIKNVQRVINQVAGAIHRTAPKALVSNGSQIIMYSSDVNGYINYYRSDRLLNEGHDPLGYLDFYMVHYYTNNGTQFSLFHKPASYWNLDKPLVIGEFPALGFTSETPKMTPVQSYEYAAANGYAGAMSWTYSNGTGGATGGDKNGGLPDCAAALDSIETKYKTYVDVIPSKSFIFTPTVKNILPEGMAFLGNTDTATMFNLKNYFILRGDTFGSNLVFKVDSQKTLAKIVIDKNGVIKVVPTKKSGILSTTISAININDTTKSISSPFIFSIVDTNSTNHLQYRNVFSSTIESVLYQPIYAVDSSSTTRWSTTYQDKQWLLIDMAKEFVLQQVKIRWEAAYGQQYQLQVSSDTITWKTVYTENNGDGGYDWLPFSPVKARYVRLNCIKRGTAWGYSIFEISANSYRDSDLTPVLIANVPDDTIMGNLTTKIKFSTYASDANIGDKIIQSVSPLSGSMPAWLIYNDSTKYLTGNPTNNDVGTYTFVYKASDYLGKFVTDTFNVTVIAGPVIVNIPTVNLVDLQVFPNPARNSLKISINTDFAKASEIGLYDYSGRVIILKKLAGEKLIGYSINLREVPQGMYILKIITSEGIVSRKIQVIK